MKNGDVYSWGHGYEGALGHSSRDAVRAPKKVRADRCGWVVRPPTYYPSPPYCTMPPGFVQSHTRLVFTRTMLCVSQVDALSGKGAVAVVCGREHTLVLCSSGDVYAFGCDDSGQLGLGFESRYQRTPVLVGALKGKQVVKVRRRVCHAVGDSTGRGRLSTVGHILSMPQLATTVQGSIYT